MFRYPCGTVEEVVGPELGAALLLWYAVWPGLQCNRMHT